MTVDTIQVWAFRVMILALGVAFYVAFRFF